MAAVVLRLRLAYGRRQLRDVSGESAAGVYVGGDLDVVFSPESDLSGGLVLAEGEERGAEDAVGVDEAEEVFEEVLEEDGAVAERLLRLREVEYVGEGFLDVSEEAETVGDPRGGAAVEGGPGFDLGDLVVDVGDQRV